MLKHSLFVLVGLIIVGCSSAQNTPGQDAMWVAYSRQPSSSEEPMRLIGLAPSGCRRDWHDIGLCMRRP